MFQLVPAAKRRVFKMLKIRLCHQLIITMMCVLLLLSFLAIVSGFSRSLSTRFGRSQSMQMSMNMDLNLISQKMGFLLADTSVSEEDVMAVTGTVSTLPDPVYAVAFAAIIFGGVAVLQFTLGDLATQEGEARVRDYLQTKKDTDRKRGYFD